MATRPRMLECSLGVSALRALFLHSMLPAERFGSSGLGWEPLPVQYEGYSEIAPMLGKPSGGQAFF